MRNVGILWEAQYAVYHSSAAIVAKLIRLFIRLGALAEAATSS